MKIVNAFIALAAVTAVVPASALAGNDSPAMHENQQMNPVMMQGQPVMMTPEMMQQQMMQHQMMQQRRQMMQGQPGMMNPGMMHAGKGCGMMKPEMMAEKQAHRKAMETHLANIEALLRQLVEQQSK